MARRLRLFLTVAILLACAGGLTALFVMNPTAREVTLDSLGLAFAFFTTPFILETTCALLFLIGLLAYNRWRLDKEGDGWVYLMTQEPDQPGLPPTITQRLQSTVLETKPEPVDEAHAAAGVIEGYLELGMAAQALQELGGETAGDTPLPHALLRSRVLAANLETDAAARLLRESAARDAAASALGSAACLENARWLLKHLQREDLAGFWLAEARALTPGCTDALPEGDSLRRLR